MNLQEKEAQKRLQHAGNLFRKNLQLKDVNSRLKATEITEKDFIGREFRSLTV